MGITIHYSGTFRSDASLAKFIEETVAFAEATDWEFVVFEKEFPPANSRSKPKEEVRYGLLLLPPECEPMHLFFNHERQLGFYYDPQESIIESWIGNPMTGEGEWVRDEIDPELKPHWSAFTKTQYAGSAVHKNIVILFKQLSGKYFSEFEVIDEADYWENGDDDYLRKRFGEGIDMNNFDPNDPKYRLPVKRI